jgi:hypothetical protein
VHVAEDAPQAAVELASETAPVAPDPPREVDALSAMIPSPKDPPPLPTFDNVEARLAYLRWLGVQSQRLKGRFPSEKRIVLLETLWYESKRAGLEPALVMAIVSLSSKFDAHYRHADAGGLMGVSQLRATLFGVTDVATLMSPQSNLRIGCILLRHHLDNEKGDLFVALARFYAEEQNPSRNVSPSLTTKWAQSVMEERRAWVMVR